jgi:hypothetical protein
MSSKKYALDFLSFVNASPTRKFSLASRAGPLTTLLGSLPCRGVSKAASSTGWVLRNQGIRNTMAEHAYFMILMA